MTVHGWQWWLGGVMLFWGAGLCWAQQAAAPSVPATEQEIATAIEGLAAKESARQVQAIFALGEGRVATERAIAALTALLAHDDAQVRWAAAWALSEVGEAAEEPVAARMREADLHVRRTASYVLARRTPESLRANRLLLPAAADSDPLVRHHARAALDSLRPDRWDALRGERQALRLALLRGFRLPEKLPMSLYNYGSRLSGWKQILGAIEEDELAGLAALLDDPSDETRIVACLCLKDLGPAAATASPKLAELLETKVLVADAAMEALAAIGPQAKAARPAVIRRLRRLSEDYDVAFRREVELLGKFGRDSADAIPVLVRLARTAPGEATRASNRGHDEAVAALAQIAAEPPAELYAWLDDKLPLRRRAGAMALGAFGARAEKAVPRLVAMLHDEDPRAALAALVAIEQIGPPAAAAIPVLAAIARKEHTGGTEFFLKYPDRTPARNYDHPRLVQVLGKLGPEALPILIEFLSHKSPELRADAARGLGDQGRAARAALAKLLEIAASEDSESADAAIVTLGKLGPEAKEAIPLLLAQVEKELRRERIRTILTALLKIDARDKRVQKALREDVAQKNYWYRQIAPSVLFEEGLTTEMDLWNFAGEPQFFPIGPRDPRWRVFVAEHVPFLLRCLQDGENAQRRRWAMAAMAHVDLYAHPEVVAALIERLEDEMARNVLIFGRASGGGTMRYLPVAPLIEQLSSPSEARRKLAADLLDRYWLGLRPREHAALLKFIDHPPAHAADTAQKLVERMRYFRQVLHVRSYPELARLAAARLDTEVWRELVTYGAAATPVLEQVALAEGLRPLWKTTAVRALAALHVQASEVRPTLTRLRDDATQSDYMQRAAQEAVAAIDGYRDPFAP